MRRFWPLLLFAIIFSIATVSTKSLQTSETDAHAIPQRIISLSPSITETLFAIGAGDNVVGVTKYCNFPKAAQALAKVGGFIDPNIEAIVALQPDVVITLSSQQHLIAQLTKLNIQVLTVKNRTLADIKQTINSIGDYTGHHTEASQVLETINTNINSIKAKTNGKPKPSVMIAMGHSTGTEHVKQVFIAGNQDFYNDLIQLAGGVNAYQGDTVKVPSLSTEGIMQINPDYIFDIFPEAGDHQSDLSKTLQRWHRLEHITAVKDDHVYIIEENYATIPGPRIFLLLDQIARILHPELDWETKAL